MKHLKTCNRNDESFQYKLFFLLGDCDSPVRRKKHRLPRDDPEILVARMREKNVHAGERHEICAHPVVRRSKFLKEDVVRDKHDVGAQRKKFFDEGNYFSGEKIVVLVLMDE